MVKFDMLNFKTGSILVSKNGTKYVLINGVSYNPKTWDFSVHNRDGSCDASNSKGGRDVVQVIQLECCPDANVLSEGIKFASGMFSKYTPKTVWSAENPVVTAAKARAAEAAKAYDKAMADLSVAQIFYK